MGGTRYPTLLDVIQAVSLEGGSAMRRDSVGITWEEVTTAWLTLGIVTFLWLV